MEVNYQRDMNHNYMILKCEDDLHEESYETRMIFANKIPGLLPCHIRYIDGRTYLGYDVTCRQSLTVFCESRKPGRKEIRNILGSILETIKVMEEYLLSPDHLILDPQLVLMKFETQEAVLAFAPFFRKDIRNSLKELTEYLLTFVAHDDQQGIVLGYRISHELTENSAGVAELLDILYEKKSAEKRDCRKRRTTGCPVSWQEVLYIKEYRIIRVPGRIGRRKRRLRNKESRKMHFVLSLSVFSQRRDFLWVFTICFRQLLITQDSWSEFL